MSRLRQLFTPARSERSMSWQDYTNLVVANTWTATFGGRESYAELLKINPIVFGAVRQRMQMFSQATFAWQKNPPGGRPGELHGNAELRVLEHPQPGVTTADMLTMFELDVSLAGNAFAWRWRDDEVLLLDPANVNIVTEELREHAKGPIIGSRKLGYQYTHDAAGPSKFLSVADERVAHFREMPDPASRHSGMSWICSAAAEIKSDGYLTDYKNKFFEHAATPNLAIVSEQPLTDEQFEMLREQLEDRTAGIDNAHRTLILEGGAKVEKVGAALGDLSFTSVQDAGENRITLASGVPAPLIGIMLGSSPTYNNFNTARRHFADSWARPQWRRAAGALSAVATAPRGSRLWYDDRDIEALQQDASDGAGIRQQDAATLRQLVDGGFTAESAIKYVATSDPAVLEHSGNLSVQLLPKNPAEDPDT